MAELPNGTWIRISAITKIKIAKFRTAYTQVMIFTGASIERVSVATQAEAQELIAKLTELISQSIYHGQ